MSGVSIKDRSQTEWSIRVLCAAEQGRLKLDGFNSAANNAVTKQEV